MQKIFTALALLLAVVALAGCVTVKPGSPMMSLASSDTRAALAVLDQRTPEDVAMTEKVIGRIAPGQVGYCRLASGKPFVAIRDRSNKDQVNIWMLDRSGELANVGSITEYRDGHVYLRNPAVQPWKSWEAAQARELFDQLAAKLAEQPADAPIIGQWPPAKNK